MIVNKISNMNYINFKAETIAKDTESQNAILMLRDPKASIKFQQNQEFAKNADSVTSNPFRALGYKLYRTFSSINDKDEQPQSTEKQLSVIA